ncbi:MAG: hypothetical protein Q9N02_04960 [Ghiorsea sp.]|nr:hypothetical protein [Ghiorsea sp.]
MFHPTSEKERTAIKKKRGKPIFTTTLNLDARFGFIADSSAYHLAGIGL